MRILITGSRTWTDVERIRQMMVSMAYSPGAVTLVSGGCPTGADRMCEEIADELGWDIEIHPADWTAHGKRAGFVRNADMVNLGAAMCLAFIKDESPGATMTAKLARDAGIPTYIFKE